MQLVRPVPQSLELVPTRSALASARLQRRLTVEQAAKRAGLTPDQVEWLEEGRVYRFPSTDHAIEATLMLASGARDRPARGPQAGRAAGAAASARRQPGRPPDRRRGALGRADGLRRVRARARRRREAGADGAGRSGRRPGGDAAEAVEDPGRGAERRRRHQLDAPGRQPDPVARLHGQEGRPRRPVRLSRRARSTTRRAAAWSRSASPASSASSRGRSRAGRTRTGWS